MATSEPRSRWHQLMRDRYEQDTDKPTTPSESLDEDDIDGIPMQDTGPEGVSRQLNETVLPANGSSLHTRLDSSNKGFRMLASLGWQEGHPLGLSPEARVDPIPFSLKQDFTGLGKLQQDSEVIALTVSQRRDMDSERQSRESSEQRKLREEQVALQADLQQEISTTLRPFYCQLCDKQFKNVVQYDEHTNSYAHHHKARAKDMQASLKPKSNQASISVRKEKERQREERALRKMVRAAGVKTGGNVVAQASVANRIPESNLLGTDRTPLEPQRKSGWARVGQTQSPAIQGDSVSLLHTTGRSMPMPPPPPPDDNPPPPPPPS